MNNTKRIKFEIILENKDGFDPLSKEVEQLLFNIWRKQIKSDHDFSVRAFKTNLVRRSLEAGRKAKRSFRKHRVWKLNQRGYRYVCGMHVYFIRVEDMTKRSLLSLCRDKRKMRA